MSASIGTSAEPAGLLRTPPPVHEHVWGLMCFELVDDRPLVRQECQSCGFVRAYRAWERYWTPGEAEVRR